jgi:superfamily II DNA/RNA helicase
MVVLHLVSLQGTQRFIAQMGFKRMTPVQAITIPLLLKQRDVAVEASCVCL